MTADEHRNETRIRALKDAIVTDKLLHPDDSQSRQNEVQIESNTTREVAETSKERLICVRPQIQREQNVYLDSLAYRMIGKCPAEQSDTTVDKQCQKGFSNVGFNNIVPVTSYASNMTYVNIHCLKCNENTSLEIKIKYWSPIITIESWGYTHHFFTDPQDTVSYLLKYEYFNGMKTGNIHFVPPNPELLQPCQQYDVTSCNETGLWDVYNKTTEELCLSGYSMPVIRRPSATGTALSFRNMACLYCNQPNESFGKLVIRKGSICLKRKTIFGPTPRFNMTLNVPNLNSSMNQEDKSTLISKQYIDATVALTLIKQTKACPNGYIAILVSSITLVYYNFHF